jgi:protein-L-isoaspartate(D-aspartate) O-methyltransferase
MRGLLVAALVMAMLTGGRCGAAQPDEPARPLDENASRRMRMVDEQLRARGLRDERVLGAIERVPRHLFVPAAQQRDAYEDHPLPIGHGQTISQPYIVGYMTEALRPKPTDKVLEIGTGSGYQAAVLGELVREVYSIEIVAPLGRQAAATLAENGYTNVHVRVGDGYQGWPEQAPFDGIIVTAAPDHVPQPLVDQLAVGGRMVIPVGDLYQELMILTRTEAGIREERALPVMFVPMTGKAREKEE